LQDPLNNYKSLSYTTNNDQRINTTQDHEYYCVQYNQEPYVRIINIEVVDGLQTQRHLDTILIQCTARLGPINRIFICNNPRFTDASIKNSLLAHIELVDNSKHDELRLMLTDIVFHGLQWSVSLAFHLFHGFDTDYRQMTHQCATCPRFSQDLYDHTKTTTEETNDHQAFTTSAVQFKQRIRFVIQTNKPHNLQSIFHNRR
jgi:hypothetical protein